MIDDWGSFWAGFGVAMLIAASAWMALAYIIDDEFERHDDE
jgi:hypothetical protein